MKLSRHIRLAVVAALTLAILAAPTSAAAASYYYTYSSYGLGGVRYWPTATVSRSPAYSWWNTLLSRFTRQAEVQPAPAVRTAPAPAAATTSAAETVQGLTAEEQQMLNLVNAERAKHGLAPLKADLELTRVARAKSRDMVQRGYFSHNSPTYGSPFEMMKRFGVSYNTAAENIAGNGSVDGAHRSLMNSSGHRANILSPKFTHIGIGIVHGGRYGMMFTQLFKG